MQDDYDFSPAGLAKKAFKPFQQNYNEQTPADNYSSLQADYGALGAPIAAGTQQLARAGMAAGKTLLGAGNQLGGQVNQGLGYLFGNNYKNSLGKTYGAPVQAAGLQQNTAAQSKTPLMPLQQTEQNQQVQQSQLPPVLGNAPVNQPFIQATPENVPARLGNNGQVQLTNPDGLGSGSMDFGSPEKNALMAQKIQAGKGTVNVGNGFFNAQNFADSIRANTVAKVGAAYRAGNITGEEASRLMAEAKRGGEPEPFFDPEQAALQQANQQFNQTLQQQNQQFQDTQALEREKLAQGLGSQTPNKYALNPQGQAYPTQGEAGDRYFQQQQERRRKTEQARKWVSALDGKWFMNDQSKKTLNAARAWLEANGQV